MLCRLPDLGARGFSCTVSGVMSVMSGSVACRQRFWNDYSFHLVCAEYTARFI